MLVECLVVAPVAVTALFVMTFSKLRHEHRMLDKVYRELDFYRITSKTDLKNENRRNKSKRSVQTDKS